MANTSRNDKIDLKLVILIVIVTIALVVSVVMISINNTGNSNNRVTNGFKIENDGSSVKITGYEGSDTSITIPAKFGTKKVTAIVAGAFTGTKVEKIVFSDDIESITIPAECFKNNSTIKYVKLPSCLSTIPEYMFYDCSSLVHIDFPDTIKTIGAYAFYGCSKLDYANTETEGKFYLPDSLESIEKYAFNNCSGLDQMYYGDKLTSIKEYAFSGASNLDTFAVKEDKTSNINSIGNYAFRATNLKSTTASSFSIPNVTTIGEYAFTSQGSDFTGFILPKSVNTVGKGAFAACNSLTSFVFEEKETGTLTLDSGILKNCSKLSKVSTKKSDGEIDLAKSFPDSLESIPQEMFMGCASLFTTSDLYISSNIKAIGTGAFAVYLTSSSSGSTSKKIIVAEDNEYFSSVTLKSYYVTDSSSLVGTEHCILTDKEEKVLIAYIGLFSTKNYGKYDNGDSSIFKFIPLTIESINDYAFAGVKFDSILIPASVKSLGNNVFDSSSISAVYVENKDCEITNKTFENVIKNTTENTFEVLTYISTDGRLNQLIDEYYKDTIGVGSYMD